MKHQETFKMTYSAKQQEEIQAIRNKYVPQEENKMDRLRALDAGVTQKATVLSMTLGIVGTLILGIGMSLIMSDFGKLLGSLAMPVGIGIGAVGIAVLACAYPVYRHKVKKEREKIAPEILRLTDELMK